MEYIVISGKRYADWSCRVDCPKEARWKLEGKCSKTCPDGYFKYKTWCTKDCSKLDPPRYKFGDGECVETCPDLT